MGDLLPGRPTGRIQAVWEALSAKERDALLPHLLGGTSAEWLSIELTEAGHRIGATSIKSYRRSLRQQGVTV